eukprot:CAMPEP_0177687936 /NCGR_PEP_ID=MMETSP0447-20121125/34397_1 /TAXON_ID=0 /ORGANISM="Stygamoeba regulata, Strain BSH-02190019" /LENGTH=118 /DNA_ID=CAMNT_0019198217 /DNA_START=127 /DNA_END=483 /DNA_ORIENTATION=+
MEPEDCKAQTELLLQCLVTDHTPIACVPEYKRLISCFADHVPEGMLEDSKKEKEHKRTRAESEEEASEIRKGLSQTAPRVFDPDCVKTERSTIGKFLSVVAPKIFKDDGDDGDEDDDD